MLKTLFFGTPEFSLKSLQALSEESEILAVVTQPDRPRGRGQKLSPCEVKAWALEKNLPTFSPASLRKDGEERTRLLDFIQKTSPDLFLVTAYGLIFPEEFLKLAKLGAFNVHASLLPRWRGAAPIQRAIEAGDQETGVSLQRLVLELDAGDVFLERKMALTEDMDAFSLSQRLSELSYELVKDFLNSGGPVGKTPRPQSPKLITHAEKIDKAEGFWQPTWSVLETSRRIRAFAAWPKVTAQIEGGPQIKLLESRPAQKTFGGEPGEIHLDAGHVYLHCSDASETLELTRIQLPGKAPCAAYDYFQNVKSRTKLLGL